MYNLHCECWTSHLGLWRFSNKTIIGSTHQEDHECSWSFWLVAVWKVDRVWFYCGRRCLIPLRWRLGPERTDRDSCIMSQKKSCNNIVVPNTTASVESFANQLQSSTSQRCKNTSRNMITCVFHVNVITFSTENHQEIFKLSSRHNGLKFCQLIFWTLLKQRKIAIAGSLFANEWIETIPMMETEALGQVDYTRNFSSLLSV